MDLKLEQLDPMVVFVDEKGVEHKALVTAVWPGEYAGNNPPTNEPGINLVFVSSDPSKDDSYGRQIERRTSVVHKSGQPAPGNYWKRLTE